LTALNITCNKVTGHMMTAAHRQEHGQTHVLQQSSDVATDCPSGGFSFDGRPRDVHDSSRAFTVSGRPQDVHDNGRAFTFNGRPERLAKQSGTGTKLEQKATQGRHR
jgi:hypothetical protein